MKATPLCLVALAVSAPVMARQQTNGHTQRTRAKESATSSQANKTTPNGASLRKCHEFSVIANADSTKELNTLTDAATDDDLVSLEKSAKWCVEHGDRRTRMDAFQATLEIAAVRGARLASKERQVGEQEATDRMTKVLNEKMTQFAAAASKSQQALIRENNNLWDTYDKLYATYTETYRIAHLGA